jgi:hypothetical protein
MAAHGDQAVELNSTAPFDDFKSHRDMYLRFLGIVKYSVIGIVILLVLMAIFLV